MPVLGGRNRVEFRAVARAEVVGFDPAHAGRSERIQVNRHEDVAVPTVCGGRPLHQRARFVGSAGHDGLEPPLHNQLSHALCDIERHVLFIDAVRTRGAEVVPAMAGVDDHSAYAQVQHIWRDLLREQRRIRRGVRCRRLGVSRAQRLASRAPAPPGPKPATVPHPPMRRSIATENAPSRAARRDHRCRRRLTGRSGSGSRPWIASRLLLTASFSIRALRCSTDLDDVTFHYSATASVFGTSDNCRGSLRIRSLLLVLSVPNRLPIEVPGRNSLRCALACRRARGRRANIHRSDRLFGDV